MVTLQTIDLGISLPTEGLCAVVMQPYVTSDGNAPQCWPEPDTAQQLQRVRRVLLLAENPDHGAAHTHFTIFPEYSIPGLQGVRLVESEVQQDVWPANSVVIAGLAGLSRSDYGELCSASDTADLISVNSPNAVQQSEWVNCCVVWAKSAQAGQEPTVRRYVQPKLRPCDLEGLVSEEHMFCGQGMYLFKAQMAAGRPLFFTCVLCYDWIARHGSGGDTGVLALISQMDETSRANNPDLPQPLDLVFLLERNSKPNYPDFLEHTRDFFTKHLSHVTRDRSMVVIANTAGRRGPGRCTEFGFSGIVCHPNSPFEGARHNGRGVAPPSFAVLTTQLRQRDSLHACKEALFRENGECIHSFKFFPPATVEGVSGDPRRPLSPLNVHCLDGGAADPRLKGAQVPAVVKWVNDEVDDHALPSYINRGLQPCLQTSLDSVIAKVRVLPQDTLGHLVESGTARLNPDITCVDEYDQDQREAFKHLVWAMATFETVQPVTLGGTQSHATTTVERQVVEVSSVYGPSHLENYKHMEQALGRNPRARRVVFSQATDSVSRQERDRRYTEVKPPFALVDYTDLTQLLRTARSQAELAAGLNEFIDKAKEQTDDRVY